MQGDVRQGKSSDMVYHIPTSRSRVSMLVCLFVWLFTSSKNKKYCRAVLYLNHLPVPPRNRQASGDNSANLGPPICRYLPAKPLLVRLHHHQPSLTNPSFSPLPPLSPSLLTSTIPPCPPSNHHPNHLDVHPPPPAPRRPRAHPLPPPTHAHLAAHPSLLPRPPPLATSRPPDDGATGLRPRGAPAPLDHPDR